MNHYEFINSIKTYENLNKSEKMSAYMRGKFEFLGINAPLRYALEKEYFKELKTSRKIDWDFVEILWKEEQREFQYIATDYLNNMKNYLKYEDLDKLYKLIKSKSWWDSVDNFPRLISKIVDIDKNTNTAMGKWSRDGNLWIRRVSIIYQLHRKDKTNEEFLKRNILNNLNGNEFFINKAIGWALRDYSKYNSAFVREFIDENRENLSTLSIKEASKYL